MKIIIELDTNMDSMDKIIAVLGSFKAGDDTKTVVLEPYKPPTIGGKVPPFEVIPSSKRPISDELKKLEEDIKGKLKYMPKSRNKKMIYSTEFKREIIDYYNISKKQKPQISKGSIAKKFGIPVTSFAEWTKGRSLKRLGSWDKRGNGEVERSRDKKVERDKKMIEYLNNNPYDSWEEVAEKFGMSSTAIYNIAKKGRVRIMKRSWQKIITKETAERKPEEPKIVEQPTRTMGQVILKFEKSRVDADKTISGINECISKGSLLYREDADKFGFDRRMLPTTDWYDFMTEVAKTVNRIMGIEVILDPTLSGITFKK